MKKLAVPALVTLAAVAAAGPAAAEYYGDSIYISGTLKAMGTYDDGGNKLCVRAYNSAAGASAVLTVRLNGPLALQVATVTDAAGDNAWTCTTVIGFEDATVVYNLQHVASNGSITGQSHVGTL